MAFDMRTVLLSFLITNVISTLVMIMLWRQSYKRINGSSYWVLTISLQSLAILLVIFRGFIWDWLSIIASNLFFIVGLQLGLIGFYKFLGIKKKHLSDILLFLLFTIFVFWFTYFYNSKSIRIVLLSSATLIICAQISWLLLFSAPSHFRKFTRSVGYVFVGYVVFSFLRIINEISLSIGSNDIFNPAGFDAFIMVGYQVLLIFLTYNLALMFNQQLIHIISAEEEKFSKAFYSSPYSIVISKLNNGEIIDVNKGFTLLFGHNYDEVIGKSVNDIQIWTNINDRDAFIKELLQKGSIIGREYNFRNKSGDLVLGILSSEMIEINNEICILSSFNDITLQKNTEDALKESEKQLRSFFENSLDAILLTAPDGRIFTANPATCKMFGYTEAEIISLGRKGLVDMSDPRLYILLDERLKKGKARGELTMIRKDGTRFTAEVSSALFSNSSGEKRSSMIIRDLTEQLNAQKTILHREMLITEMGRVAKIGGWEFDSITGKGTWTDEISKIHDMDPNDETSMQIGLNFYKGESKALIENAIKEAIEFKKPYDLELEMITCKGRHVWVHTIGTPVIEDDKVVQIRGSFQDITERKISELALKESEERLRLSLSAANQGLWDLNVQTGEAVVNREYATMLGYDFETFSETNAFWLERLHPADKEITAKIYKDYVSGKISEYKVEFRQKTVDGNWLWILSSGKIVSYDEEGKPLRMMGTHTNITERKRTEFNEKLANEILGILNNKENNLEMITEIVNIIKFRTDLDLVGIRLNNGAGFPEYIHSGFNYELHIPIQSEREIFGELILGDNNENMGNRETKYFYEGICGSIGIAIKRNEAEDKIKQLNEELEQRIKDRTWQLENANKELEAFTYTVSHDLRAPLRAIYGFSQILTEEYENQLDLEGKQICNMIMENTQNMGRLIDDLLSLSHLSRAEINRFPTDMHKLVQTVITELGKINDVSKVTFKMNDILGTNGDSSLLKQVWFNLIHNAIKFSGNKTDALIEMGSYPEEGRNVYFIKDNGVGFNMNYYHKLFGAFQRLHSVKDFEGTGVGLAIVKRIIDKHGGAIWAEAELNKGAIFYFSLPNYE